MHLDITLLSSPLSHPRGEQTGSPVNILRETGGVVGHKLGRGESREGGKENERKQGERGREGARVDQRGPPLPYPFL
jgi:hypothetical protein